METVFDVLGIALLVLSLLNTLGSIAEKDKEREFKLRVIGLLYLIAGNQYIFYGG